MRVAVRDAVRMVVSTPDVPDPCGVLVVVYVGSITIKANGSLLVGQERLYPLDCWEWECKSY